MTDARYVSNAAWLESAGRPDTIDEIADQFERPDDQRHGAAAFWAPRTDTGLRPRAPRSAPLLHRRRGARLAG